MAESREPGIGCLPDSPLNNASSPIKDSYALSWSFPLKQDNPMPQPKKTLNRKKKRAAIDQK